MANRGWFLTSMVLSIMMCTVALYVVAAVVDNKLAAVDCDGLILFVSCGGLGFPTIAPCCVFTFCS